MTVYYSTKEWRATRMERIKIDQFKCRRCKEHYPEGFSLNVHHIKPLKEDGNDDTENLITLCLYCHQAVEGLGLSREEIEQYPMRPGPRRRRPIPRPKPPTGPPDYVLYAHPGGFVIYRDKNVIDYLVTTPLCEAPIVAGPQ